MVIARFYHKRFGLSILGALAIIACVTVTAQDSPGTAPVLSDGQKLELQAAFANVLLGQKDLTIAQLKFDAAKQTLAQLQTTLEKPGFSLDVQTMAYTKPPTDAKEAK